MRNVVCIVYLVAIRVGFLGGSVIKVDIAVVVKGKRVTSGFGFQVMLGGPLFYFRSLYIADILWKYIQASLGSLRLSCHN